MREIEIKLRVEDLRAVRRGLLAVGFERLTPRLFERNVLFDTPRATLRREGQLLRLRTKGSRWWLTFKARPEQASRHKVREEIEIETSRGPELVAILERLGYYPSFEYQKYRTEYRQAGSRGMAVVDETPIGNFLELEGAPGWIDRTAAGLGYGSQDYILESYGALYLAWCGRQGVTPSHMVFPGKKGLLRVAG